MHPNELRDPKGPESLNYTTVNFEETLYCSHKILTTLRKHAYLNILKILPRKYENFQMKKTDIFHISAQNKDCGYSLKPPRRGGSNEYPQSIFFSRNKKNNLYPCKPQFYYIKWSLRGLVIDRFMQLLFSLLIVSNLCLWNLSTV